MCVIEILYSVLMLHKPTYVVYHNVLGFCNYLILFILNGSSKAIFSDNQCVTSII